MPRYPVRWWRDLKPFSVLFWSAGWKDSKFGWTIRVVLGCEISHVGWFFGYRYGFPLAFEADRNGPSVNEFKTTYPPKYVGEWVKPLTEEEIKRLIYRFQTLDPLKYDWLSCLFQGVGLDSVSRIRCDELVRDPAARAGRDLKGTARTPQGIFESEELRICEIDYRGYQEEDEAGGVLVAT